MVKANLLKMSLKYSIVSILLLVCNAADLPRFVRKCQYGDTNCIANVATELIRNYPAELSQLGFIQIDPWHVNEVVIDENVGPPINLKLILSNAMLRGFSTSTFYKAVGWSKDPSNSKFEMHAAIPKLNFTGNYDVIGRIMYLPIQGKGEYNLILEDILMQFKFKASVQVRDGKQYLKIRKVKLRLDPTKFKLNMTNLFDGNEELRNSFLEVINENWRDAWDELAPATYKVNEAILLETLQAFFDKFAYEDIFLPQE